MYSRLMPPAKTDKKTEDTADVKSESGKNDQQLLVQVSSLSCNNGTIHFSDALPKGGFKTTISEIDFTVNNLSTAPEKSADYELSLLLDNDATFNTDGTFSVTPLTATSSTELTGLKIQRGWPYLAQYLTAPVKGTLDLSADLSFSKADGLSMEHGTLSLSRLSARYGVKEGFDLARLQVNDATFRQKENRLEIGGSVFPGEIFPSPGKQMATSRCFHSLQTSKRVQRRQVTKKFRRHRYPQRRKRHLYTEDQAIFLPPETFPTRQGQCCLH